jgi:thiol-disulfide isomerase/thioredoxin
MLAIMTGGRALMERVPVLSRNPVKLQRVFGVLMILVGVAIGFGWDRRFQSAVLNIFPNYGAGLTAFENSQPVRDALDARSESKTTGTGINRFSREGSGGASSALSEIVDLENENLGDYGYAPEIITTGEWFNIDVLEAEAQDGAITMADLRGKVVLVDFWTYSCINCVRTIPHLRSWYDAYRDDGFVIIGVHTPEFAFERDSENVHKAMKELGVNWPVVLDNDYEQWRAYNNRYWPAHYFIDATGRLRYFHFGEGKYDASEEVIRALLEEADRLPSEAGGSAARAAEKAEARLESRTAETYLGYARARGFVSDVSPVPNRPTLYRPPGPQVAGVTAAGSPADLRPAAAPLANGEWTLDGRWTIAREYIVPEGTGVLQLGFHAKDVFLVIEPTETGGRIEVKVDGNPVMDTGDVRDGVLLPGESRLYHLVQQAEPAERVLRLEVSGELRLFAFTFG